MAINVNTEVEALVEKIKTETKDKHEAALVTMAAAQLLQLKFGEAQAAAEEEKAQLVLEKRAAAQGGKTVEEQKAEAAVQLRKRIGEPVSAREVLNVAMSTVAAAEGK